MAKLLNFFAGVQFFFRTLYIGHREGAIRLLECKLNRPLHWFICSLQLNELPLRHLCKHLLGQTEGPGMWKRPLGQALTTCDSMPRSPKGFQCITEGDPLPEIDVTDLSRDQSYLYRIITAIRTGTITDDLLREKPGAVSLERWVTTASRICRVCCNTAALQRTISVDTFCCLQLWIYMVQNQMPLKVH